MENNDDISFVLPQITPTPKDENIEKPIENKKSIIIPIDENTEYNLTIQLNKSQTIFEFLLSQNIDVYSYKNFYNLTYLLHSFKIDDTNNNDILNQIFDEIQKSISNKIPEICLNDKTIKLKLFLNGGENIIEFELNQQKLETDDILLNLLAEIKSLKTKIKILTNDNQLLKNKVKLLENQTIKQDIIHQPKNIKFKKDLTSNSNSGNFAIFNSKQDNKTYLATGNINTNNVDLYILEQNNIIFSKSLQGHNKKILSVDYYYDSSKNNEYLSSVDKNNIVIIWDKNFKKYTLINTDYIKCNIYGSLLLFNIYNNDYIITSVSNKNNYTKVYSLNNGQFVKNIPHTINNSTYNIIFWFYNNNYYIIELCDTKIFIYNLITNEIYSEFITEEESYYMNGFIYNEKYLFSSSLKGFVKIWDLINKNLYKNIEIECSKLSDIIQMDQKYIICADTSGNFLIVIDLFDNRVVEKIDAKHGKEGKIVKIKKFEFESDGDCLLTTGWDHTIKLWSI